MTVRPATRDDVAAVLGLEQLLFGGDAWSEQSVREELLGPRRRAVVACDPDVVGYAVIVEVGDLTDLQRVAVHPSYRRRGVARDLLAAVAPTGPLLLEVGAHNAAALAFYAAEGFTEIDRRRRYYRDGSDAVVMARNDGAHRRPGPQGAGEQ